jgi:type I restriction enzyme S subunit
MAAIIDYRGKSPSKTTSGIPLVTAKIIKSGRIEQPDEFIAEGDFDVWMQRGLPQRGDVVMTTEAPLGEVGQLDGTKVALAQRVITLRGKAELLDNTFLKYLLQSEPVQADLRARATGTTVLGIRQSELRRVTLTLPPLPEQKAIARILGGLDDKIELNRKMNSTLAEMARVLFRSWFIEFDPVHAKAAGHKPSGMSEGTAALFPASFEKSKLGNVPAGWKVGSILQQADLLSGGTPKTSIAEYWDGDILWASAKDVSQCDEQLLITTERRITKRGLEGSSTKMIPAFATVVVARGATTGRLVMLGEKMAMNQTCYGLCSKIGSPFSLYCQAQDFIQRMVHAAHGSVFDTITTRTFETTDVLLPPHDVLGSFDRAVTPLFEGIRNNLYQSRTLTSMRDALLPGLLSGEIPVSAVQD